MIVGLGIDIVDIERIKSKLENNQKLKEHIFSKSEINYCEKQRNKMEHYAARFAAKEALLKALGSGLNSEIKLHESEIVNEKSGKPLFNFMNESKKIIESGNYKILVSLSHTKNTACAVVILTN